MKLGWRLSKLEEALEWVVSQHDCLQGKRRPATTIEHLDEECKISMLSLWLEYLNVPLLYSIWLEISRQNALWHTSLSPKPSAQSFLKKEESNCRWLSTAVHLIFWLGRCRISIHPWLSEISWERGASTAVMMRWRLFLKQFLQPNS